MRFNKGVLALLPVQTQVAMAATDLPLLLLSSMMIHDASSVLKNARTHLVVFFLSLFNGPISQM